MLVVRVAVFAVGMAVIVTVARLEIAAGAVGVAVAAQNPEAHEVRCKAKAANNKHNLGVADVRRIEEALDGFENDGDAETDEESRVEEGTEDFGTEPLEEMLERVTSGRNF